MNIPKIGLFLSLLALAACQPDKPNSWQGWVEGDMMFIGPEDFGRLTELPLTEGAKVSAGDFLFAIDATTQAADVDNAKAALGQAQARLARLQAAQQRPEEIAVLEANLNQAKAALDFSTSELARVRALTEKGIASKQQLDQVQANFDHDRAAVENVSRQIEVSRLSGRSEDIEAANSAVDMTKAQLHSSEARFFRTRVYAKIGGIIEEIYFRPGEIVPLGKPIVSLLPPENIKLRFFVPESNLPQMQIGKNLAISCDGCAKGLTAKVSFISQTAEFTPPVIYSLQERQKLVFRIEAKPDQPEQLRVGQPVSVQLGSSP